MNVTNDTPGVPVDTSLTESASPISIDGTRIIGVDGEEVRLIGVNVFGNDQAVSPLVTHTCS